MLPLKECRLYFVDFSCNNFLIGNQEKRKIPYGKSFGITCSLIFRKEIGPYEETFAW